MSGIIRGSESIIAFSNRTQLDTPQLETMCIDAVRRWRLGTIDVRVRYGRGADFSGACYYRTGRIFINIGQRLRYPYRLTAHLARARRTPRGWSRPVIGIELADGYQLVLFIFLHEIYHWLIQRARRNRRQKESMCDRFAARVLVDQYGAALRDADDRPVSREAWDFQDLDGFVASAGTVAAVAVAARKPILEPSAVVGAAGLPPVYGETQGLLFPLR